MAVNTHLAGRSTWVLVVLLWGLFGSSAAADVYVMSDQHDGCVCVPNAENFGYFDTKWRAWPGQPRPAKTFPQSMGRETVPTPAGTRQFPMRPGVTPLPRLPAEIPPLVPGEQGILPPDMQIQIEEGRLGLPTEPPLPLEPELPPLSVPQERPQGLPPTLPLPPLPGPATPPGEERLPDLPLPSESPFQLEPFRGGSQPEADNSGRLPDLVPEPDDSGAINSRNDFRPEVRADSVRGAAPGGAPLLQMPQRPFPADRRPQGHPLRSNDTYSMPPQSPWSPAGQQVTYFEDPVKPWAQPLPQRPGREATAGRAAARPEARPDSSPTTGTPTPGLNGYCPVELVENEKWLSGDRRWTVVHRGRTYILSGPGQQQRFRANPERYAPVFSGADPVLAVDRNRSVPGKTEFCVVYDGRLYMFSSASSLAHFRQNPKRYAAVAQRATF